MTNGEYAAGLSDLTEGSPCCSADDSTLQVGLLEAQRGMFGPADRKGIATQAVVAPDAGAQTGGVDSSSNRKFDIEANVDVPGVETDPGDSGLDAARVAEPPRSALRRLLTAIMELGSASTSNR